jgi:hypothetical protein
MDEAVKVGLGEAFGDLPTQADHLLRIAGAALETALERLPGHQLHDDPVARVRLDQIVDADDRRVIQARLGLRFPAEALAELGIVERVGMELLEGDRTLQALVPGAPRGAAHSSDSQRLHQPVWTDLPLGFHGWASVRLTQGLRGRGAGSRGDGGSGRDRRADAAAARLEPRSRAPGARAALHVQRRGRATPRARRSAGRLNARGSSSPGRRTRPLRGARLPSGSWHPARNRLAQAARLDFNQSARACEGARRSRP